MLLGKFKGLLDRKSNTEAKDRGRWRFGVIIIQNLALFYFRVCFHVTFAHCSHSSFLHLACNNAKCKLHKLPPERRMNASEEGTDVCFGKLSGG